MSQQFRKFDLKRNLWELLDNMLSWGPQRCPKTGSAINWYNARYYAVLVGGGWVTFQVTRHIGLFWRHGSSFMQE